VEGILAHNFSLRGLKDPAALHQSQLVFTNICVHRLFQPDWPPYAVQRDEYAGTISDMRDAMIAAATRDVLKVAYLASCRKKLDTGYYYLGRFAELVTREDPTILDALGYPVPKSTAPKGNPVLGAPQNPSVKHGEKSGCIVARVDRLPSARSIIGQYTTGDPTVEANWGVQITFGTWHDLLFADLTPGQLYSFRFCGVFAKGHGPWSAVVTLMAT